MMKLAWPPELSTQLRLSCCAETIDGPTTTPRVSSAGRRIERARPTTGRARVCPCRVSALRDRRNAKTAPGFSERALSPATSRKNKHLAKPYEAFTRWRSPKDRHSGPTWTDSGHPVTYLPMRVQRQLPDFTAQESRTGCHVRFSIYETTTRVP